MTTSQRSRGARILAAAAFAIAPIIAFAPPAAAATHDINFDCAGDGPFSTHYFTLNETVDVTAPDSVTAGDTFTVVVDPTPGQLPTEVDGYTVERVEDMRLKVPVPDNSTFVDATLSGGSDNLGTVDITVNNGIGTIYVSGPLQGGESYELPTVTITLEASGPAGSTIATQLYGTSYDDPGLTFTAYVSSWFGTIEVPTSCYPNPNPVLTTTRIA